MDLFCCSLYYDLNNVCNLKKKNKNTTRFALYDVKEGRDILNDEIKRGSKSDESNFKAAGNEVQTFISTWLTERVESITQAQYEAN